MMNLRLIVFVSLFSLLPSAWAARVLIIGPVGTIQTLKDVLPSDDTGQTGGGPIPDAATLATFDEVWDLRGIPGVPLTADEIARYVNYMALGKRLVVVGEHNAFCGETQCFKPRNDSLVMLINAAGGGELQYDDSVGSLSTETVQAPFTEPNAIANNDVTWPSSSTLTTPGTGQFITVDVIKNSGTALAFARGTLTNAAAGTLVVVFDTNWLEPLPETPTQNEQDLRGLLRNIVSFLRGPQLPDVASLQCMEPGTTTLGDCAFASPFGVAVYQGTVYVADQGSHAVWKIDSTKQKTLVAGLQIDPDNAPDVRYNGDGINARQALLHNPTAVAVDSEGNLYIADTGNHVIRKVAAVGGQISADALITTVAGVPTQFGVDDPTLLFAPRGVAVDSSGNIFIADTMNQQIRKAHYGPDVPTPGMLSVVAGLAGFPGGNTGPVVCPLGQDPCLPAPARFNKPVGVAVTSGGGTVYVADEGNNAIKVVTSGSVRRMISATPLKSPTGVVFDSESEEVLAVDFGNHAIRRVVASCDGCPSPDPDVLAGTIGQPGATGPALNSPNGLAVDGSTLYIADYVNKRIGVVQLTSP